MRFSWLHRFGSLFSRLFRYHHASKVAWITGVLILAYIFFVGSASLFIYQKHVENRYTALAERLFPYPAAIVDHEVIPLKRFRLEVAARRHYATKHNITTTPTETEQFVMNQLINRTLYGHALQTFHTALDETAIQNQINDIYKQVGGQDKLVTFLHDNYGNPVDITLFTTWIHEAAAEAAVQQQLLTKATVRHILVAVPDGATADQVEAARVKASQIRAEIAPDLHNFSEVAHNRSEDVASRDNGGAFGSTNRGDDAPILSADFENTVFTLALGQLSQPIRTHYGWHIVVVDERTGHVDLSKKAYTAELRSTGHVHVLLKPT